MLFCVKQGVLNKLDEKMWNARINVRNICSLLILFDNIIVLDLI